MTAVPRRLLAVPAALALAAAVGCGGPKLVPVSGVVRLDGKPYPEAVVSFQPLADKTSDNPGRGSSAETDKDGRFNLIYDGQRPGALVGKHRVRIFTKLGATDHVEGEPQPPAAPGKFVKVQGEPIPAEWHEQSTKEFVVPPGGTDKADFNIETRPAAKK